MLQTVALAALLLLISWWLFRFLATLAQRRAQQPRAPGPSAPAQRPSALVEAPADSATHSLVPVPAFVTRAFPVSGLLPPVREHARALEVLLQQREGVTTAYVSPVTALAYLDYLPGRVTEDQLVQSIERAGYGVGDAAQRFDWRHAPALAVPARLQRSRPVARVAPRPRRRPTAAVR